MSPLSRILLAATLLLPICSAWAGVNVTYLHPETFFDYPPLEVDRERILKELSDHFASLEARLPPGQNLDIEVTDLMLAGRTRQSGRTGQEIRVLKGDADSPTMHLRFRLEADGKTMRSGEDDLANMMYLYKTNKYPANDNLRYEKQMIDDWFAQRFPPPSK